MITLLGQLVAPPIQRGPIRLPGTGAEIERKAPKDSRTIIDKDSLEEPSENIIPEPSNKLTQEDIEAAKKIYIKKRVVIVVNIVKLCFGHTILFT